MTFRRLMILVAVLVAVASFWTWNNSASRQITRELSRLAELVSKSGNESGLIGLARARDITELFATDFEVRAEQLGFATRDRQRLIGFIHGYRRGPERIGMRIFDTSLTLDTGIGRATQQASFQFTGRGPLGAPSETYRVQINWVEQDGRWKIDYVDLIEIVG
jgi:hypothetical protein